MISKFERNELLLKIVEQTIWNLVRIVFYFSIRTGFDTLPDSSIFSWAYAKIKQSLGNSKDN